ncbi:MAG: type II secretion system F family protein [Parcubacteria group bacterium]
MPLFKYKVLDADGKPREGTQEAKDKFALYHVIKQDGSTVVFTEEVKPKTGLSFLKSVTFFESVKTHDKILFAKNLSKMLEAGLPVTRGLSIMERQAKGLFKKILISLNESISKGNTLSDSMKAYPKVFSTLFVSMVRAGEESGNMSSALQNVGMQMEKSYQLTKKVRGALMYPAVIFSLMLVIGVLMMVYMVPTLTATFVGLGVKLPLSTRIIIAISDFLKNYFIFVVLGAIFFVFISTIAFRTPKGKRIIDATLLRTPLIKDIVKHINSARTARTLSSLLSSGVDIVVAIGVTKDIVQNSYYKEVLDKVQTTIEKGGQISTVFTENDRLYPLFVGEMVSVGEETGKIGEMLMSVALFYEEEVDQKTKDMSSIIEPVLMIIIGLGVGAFAISMLGPTYSLADAI